MTQNDTKFGMFENKQSILNLRQETGHSSEHCLHMFIKHWLKLGHIIADGQNAGGRWFQVFAWVGLSQRYTHVSAKHIRMIMLLFD